MKLLAVGLGVMLMVVLSVSFVLSEEESSVSSVPAPVVGNADVYVAVSTVADMSSTIVQSAGGVVDSTIICNALTCNTNIQGGTVNVPATVPAGQTVNVNQFNEYVTSGSGHSGSFSLGELIDGLGATAGKYYDGVRDKYDDSLKLWGLLDTMFVSHKEFSSTYNNVEFLAGEVDMLRAENGMLKEYLNVTLNSATLECRAAINKAHRINSKVMLSDGSVVDIPAFGDRCVSVVNETSS